VNRANVDYDEPYLGDNSDSAAWRNPSAKSAGLESLRASQVNAANVDYDEPYLGEDSDSAAWRNPSA